MNTLSWDLSKWVAITQYFSLSLLVLLNLYKDIFKSYISENRDSKTKRWNKGFSGTIIKQYADEC